MTTKPTPPAAPRTTSLVLNPKIAGETEAYAFYAAYCKRYHLQTLPFALWRKVLLAANRRIAQVLIEGETVQMPHGLGQFTIMRAKTNFEKPKINWAETKRLGQRVFHLNEHSDFFRCFLHWTKITCNFPNQGFFCFQLVRDVKRALAPIMKQPGGYQRYELQLKPDYPSRVPAAFRI